MRDTRHALAETYRRRRRHEARRFADDGEFDEGLALADLPPVRSGPGIVSIGGEDDDPSVLVGGCD